MNDASPSRRRVIGGIAATPIVWLALGAGPAGAQRIGADDLGRPGLEAEASEALVSTVRLVLRSTYARRFDTLPDFMREPRPMAPEVAEALAVRKPIPDPLRDQPVPAALNRRLPHSRGSSVWAVGGRDLIEVDPVRLTVLNIVRDAIPAPFAEDAPEADGS